MRCFRLILEPFLLLLLVCLGVSPSKAQIGFVSYGIAPTGTIRQSRPLLVWRMVPDRGMVKEVRMTLNGKPVNAHYDIQKRAVTCSLDNPLPPQSYSVHCEIVMDNGKTFIAPEPWEFQVPQNALAKIPAPSATIISGMAVINQLREIMGLPAYSLDTRLCSAATEYSHLLAKNDTNVPDSSTIIRAFCYPEPCNEVVGSTFNPLNSLLRRFFDNPYHRYAFLLPQSGDVGIGIAESKSGGSLVTLLFSAGESSSLSKYPRDGQKDIPCDWDTREEVPNPLAIHGTTSNNPRTGYPITLFTVGIGGGQINKVKATLTTEEGTKIPFFLNTRENDKENLENGVIILPKHPLNPGTTYIVSISAEDEHEEPIMERWKFTTVQNKNKK